MASNPEDDFLQYEPPPEGAYRELGIGALQGATTDLGGSFADMGATATGIASQIDPRLLAVSPTASALSAADPYAQAFVKRFGSEALGSRFFPPAPEDLEAYRDLGRLAGGITGAGEMLTARGAKAVSSGIEDFMQYLRPQAVTPDGQVMPLPDTSVTEMLASADTPGMNPKYTKDIKKAEKTAQDRLEAGEDPRKVFEDTGFMRINVDARPGREAGEAPLETKMVFDIPDNLTQINLGGLLPESVASKIAANASAKQIMDAFEKLKDPKNFFVEQGHRGGKYGRSVQFKLNQVLSKDHPLFDVFPELGEEIDVRVIEKPMKGSGGHWDDTTNTIAIGAKYLGDDRYTSTLFVHELAHVLQTRGDLPGGSSPFLVKESVSGKLFDNFALFQTTEALAERGNRDFNPYEFFNELRPKGEAKNVENLVNQARLNVKNANPAAPDNLARMWPGNTNSTARINLDEMPYRDEVLAEMYRLIGEKEAKAFKEAEAYQALGIDIYREKNDAGSLRQGPSAKGNYMKTRGEFMARLQEAYALATEGMPVGERRKLFPMDIPSGGARATKAAPGGNKGIAGSSLDVEKQLRPDYRTMRGTQLKSYDTEGAERGLVDVEGLINVDKIPEDLKKKIEFPPSGPAPKLGSTPQDFEFYQDNPAVSRPDSGKEWLESNIRFTEERYADREPSMLRGPITANLGSRNTDMFLSTDELTRLPGAMGETRGPGDPNFDRLLKQIKTEGFDPDQAGNKVVVGVNHKGEAYLMEGNTRAAVAKELGIPNIKTEVRYWNGGEMIDGPYKPEAVAARAVVNKAEGGVITLADVARNMNRRPRGVAALAPIARNMNRPMVS